MIKQFAKSSGLESSGRAGLAEHGVDPDEVRRQLERLISSPLFSQSRRYSTLLRYVVEETLEGRADRLKERTVGIDVFGRDPSYDTTADPVVRTTAAQLRHRITQYYAQPGHEGEIRIGLPPGAYVAEFRQGAATHNVIAMNVEVAPERGPGAEPAEIVPLVVLEPKAVPTVSWAKWLRFAAVGLAIGAACVFAFDQIQARTQDASLRKFWGPVWDSRGSILICIGGAQGNNGSRTPTAAQSGAAARGTGASNTGSSAIASDNGPTVLESLRADWVAWPDAMVVAQIAGIAKANGQNIRLRKSGLIAFADLRESPDVLVGAFNNQWIMRLGANLRYRYAREWEADNSYIEDQKNPGKKDWVVHYRQPYSGFLTDYGIISRVLDPTTEKMTVIASGIASYGTMAAGDFLTQEKYMKMLADRAPAGWEHKNMQVVFSTDVISGNAGPPRILATYFW